jgi:flagellar biogenesis protein FliO
MFGSWGGIILQIAITLVVVLVLVAAVYWLVRRYSTGGLGRIGRGRVPRLAVIDAMAVDGRRRLVLVRRDNIEHLLLIGGPTDVVVEQAIQRPRRPAAKPQPATPQAPAANESMPFEAPAQAESAPIPFPRSYQPTAAPPPPPFRPEPTPPPQPAHAAPAPQPQPIERPFSPIRRPAAAPPPPPPVTRPEPVSMAAPVATPTVVQFEPMSEPAPAFPELPQAPTFEESEAMANDHRPSMLNGHGRESEPELDPFSPPHPQADDTAAKVNDLEREMARLLGEITSKRS